MRSFAPASREEELSNPVDMMKPFEKFLELVAFFGHARNPLTGHPAMAIGLCDTFSTSC
jgi:hypothetical protein